MEMQAKGAVVDSIRSRYYGARKRDKSLILDEFVAITGHQRKYALRLLAAIQDSTAATSVVLGRKVYATAVTEVLVTLWESSDRLRWQASEGDSPRVTKVDGSSWTHGSR